MPIAAVAMVDGLDCALAHIASDGSHHADAIVADDGAVAERFLAEVDSAMVLWNASTRSPTAWARRSASPSAASTPAAPSRWKG